MSQATLKSELVNMDLYGEEAQAVAAWAAAWSAYFADAETNSIQINPLALPAAEFQSGVSVQASDDLQHWSPVAQATLFRLSNQGSTLVQDRIEFTGLRAKYLRLTWQGKPPAPDADRS